MRSPTADLAGWWRGATGAVFFLATAPLLSGVNVSVQVASDPFPVTQRARITVLYDGKPSPNTAVKVTQLGRAGDIAVLTTDSNGNVILPTLPPGRYFISATYKTNSFVNSLDVCMAPCGDFGHEVIHFIPTTLHGPLRVLDPDALALSEIRMEISPMGDPSADPAWRRQLSDAEQQPITNQMQVFRGVVLDMSGAVIPEAWINVVAKGSGGKNHAASLYADKVGRFSAQLPPGDYVAFILSPGFRTGVVAFTIAPKGTSPELQIVLNVGAVTQIITVSKAGLQGAALP